MRPHYPYYKDIKQAHYHQLPDVPCASAAKPFPLHVTMLPRLQVRLNQCARPIKGTPILHIQLSKTNVFKAAALKTRGNSLAKDGAVDKAQKLKNDFLGFLILKATPKTPYAPSCRQDIPDGIALLLPDTRYFR